MKCPICGNTEFNKGFISNSTSYGGSVSQITTYHDGYNEIHEDKVMVCSTCGCVQIFADFKTKQKQQL